MAETNTPWDVHVALTKMGRGELTFEQVKEVATGVKYGLPSKHIHWGDTDLGVETFNDAVGSARFSKVITPEQVAELKAVGVMPTAPKN